MDHRVGIFIDIQNLYYCIKENFGSESKLNFRKLYNKAKELGTIQTAIAYGVYKNKEYYPIEFENVLKNINFRTRFKEVRTCTNGEGKIISKANWDVGITTDIKNTIPKLDIVILVSADGDFDYLVEDLMNHGIKVIIMAVKISGYLKATGVEWFEINESFLLEK